MLSLKKLTKKWLKRAIYLKIDLTKQSVEMTGNQRNMKIGALRAFPIDRIGDNTEQRVNEAKHSGKIILPSFVLRRVYRTDQMLMIFKLINEKLGRIVFCGVFNFDGEEQKVSVPLWILKQLRIEPGEIVSIELVTAPIEKGHFAKFEPMTKSFLQITDPRAVLEHCLRNFVCITREDVISICYNGNVYELRICETLPSDTIIINEVDLTVDFQEMREDIELPEECDLDKIQENNGNNCGKASFKAFSGSGRTTDGQNVNHNENDEHSNKKDEDHKHQQTKTKRKIGIPDYDYKVGSIHFKRYKRDLIKSEPNEETNKIENSNKDKSNGNGNRNNGTIGQNNREAPRRPVTRSQTQQMRSEANHTNTDSAPSSESIPSNQKKRKRNDQKKNNNES